MKFLADVNVSCKVVERLKSQGFDIRRVPEVMDARSSDLDILEEARRSSAVLISHDQDFGAILALRAASSPSLLNVRVSYVDVERLVLAIIAVVQATEGDLLAGAVVTLDDAGVRVHALPLA